MDRSSFEGLRRNYRRLCSDASKAAAHPYPNDPAQRQAQAAPSLFLHACTPTERRLLIYLSTPAKERYGRGGAFWRQMADLCHRLDVRDMFAKRPNHFAGMASRNQRGIDQMLRRVA